MQIPDVEASSAYVEARWVLKRLITIEARHPVSFNSRGLKSSQPDSALVLDCLGEARTGSAQVPDYTIQNKRRQNVLKAISALCTGSGLLLSIPHWFRTVVPPQT